MKIVLDGFQLAEPQGTGIATYARELADTLAGAGHEVGLLYGLTGVSRDPELAWPSFVQALEVRGERHDLPRLAAATVQHALPHLAGRSVAARRISRVDGVGFAFGPAALPVPGEVWNAPGIFRAAQAYALASERSTLLRLEGTAPDIFHLTVPLPISLPGTAKVVTVHDLIPLTLPGSTRANLRHYARVLRIALRDADAVFCVSDHTRMELLRLTDVAPERAVVTHQSVAIPQRDLNIDNELLEGFLSAYAGLEPGGYFLFYGALEPKKNLARLIEAFAAARTPLPLVICGRRGWLTGDIERFLASGRARPRFLRLPYTGRGPLMKLLKGARGLVFPSLAEGFGLPVLEAMQMGCPVITSRAGGLPEVGGDAVAYVDPTDADAITAAIDRLAADDDHAAELAARGRQQARKFDPARVLERVEAGYRQALA